MLRVSNGRITLDITKGVFDSYYVSRGFYAVDAMMDEQDDRGALKQLPSCLEIPLDEMTLEQLKNYAQLVGLEYKGVRTKKVLYAQIVHYLRG